MKVLVAADDVPTGRALARVLSQAGYQAEIAFDGPSALKQLKTSRFDILLCDSDLPGDEISETIKAARAGPEEPPLFLLLSTANGREARAQAISRGADDYVVKPCSAPNLLETIAAALSRRPKPIGLPPSSSAFGRADNSFAPEGGADSARVESTVAWAELIKLSSSVLGQWAGASFEYEPPRGRESGVMVSSAAFMVDVHHLIEISCGLFVGKNSGAELARLILHNEAAGEAAVRELLAELGNNLLGNFKTALRREGFVFTIGLGQPAGMPTPSGFVRCFSVSSISSFSGSGAHVKVVVGARPALRVSVPGRKLREDMVIAVDLFADSGGLLLPAGTRLTASTIERIASQVPRGMVQVCTPATRW
ncbi:MAG TPA: response regulator [Polyangiaceae bacterium]|nr:response regulator [Polyangiaceae bacterium]